VPKLPGRVRLLLRADKCQQITRNGRHITPLQRLECFRVASRGYRMRVRAGDSIVAMASLRLHFRRIRCLSSSEIWSNDRLGVEVNEPTLLGSRPNVRSNHKWFMHESCFYVFCLDRSDIGQEPIR